ncbi:hypothetical protein M407DRAFT_243695 [Tulasnella calospora MUT 4182]|uniref:Cytochrome c oxidase-assembly factor COX23, mitochondrial n=1 Tax=Tulasnella calospora MUT 4182 TaxID=1051891 RepID=A0A0C3KYM3_9AGAM|nr:hypothetical protein M407DRAFT_247175 [Tulasnella calospora MUT 4182]KIO26473.1 hypothetical protein M407DRAFT_243695 [Tulasnella calospora MUT 4182]
MSSKPVAPPYSDENQKDNVNYQEAFKKRQAYTQFVDPCAGASKASMKCLDQNNYNKAACSAYFEAYKECKKAWMEQRRKDRRDGKDVPV